MSVAADGASVEWGPDAAEAIIHGGAVQLAFSCRPVA
jgi:hypothetical protein